MMKLINQKVLTISCYEGISNFVQQYMYIQTSINQDRNLTLQVPSLRVIFQETWLHREIKKEKDNHG